MKFCSMTLGCKVNQYETQAVESILISRGHTQMEPGGECDVCIINTCAVTAESVRKSRQAIHRMRKSAPGALLAVCGCFSQLEPEAAVELGADLVGGSADRRGFALEIERALENAGGQPAAAQESRASTLQDNHTVKPHESHAAAAQESRASTLQDNHVAKPHESHAAAAQESHAIATEDNRPHVRFEELPPGGVHSRTRALLKIQDGCDNFCAYCVIPYARGRARSLPPERAIEYARALEEQGFREIVVTGVELSSYGKDLPGAPQLTEVLYGIGGAAFGARLRLGSLDPGAVTEEFCLELSGIPNICDHFHLSLQSGCDETLRRMGRKYGTGDAMGAISALRRRFPDCGLTADLITGFPGETDREFGQTMEFIKSAAFSNMHVFPYSPRPGTRAAAMSGQVDKNIRRERARLASQAAADMTREFKRGLIGKRVDVLFERERDGHWRGHAGNYIEVSVKSGGERNSVRLVLVTEVTDGAVRGEIVE